MAAATQPIKMKQAMLQKTRIEGIMLTESRVNDENSAGTARSS